MLWTCRQLRWCEGILGSAGQRDNKSMFGNTKWPQSFVSHLVTNASMVGLGGTCNVCDWDPAPVGEGGVKRGWASCPWHLELRPSGLVVFVKCNPLSCFALQRSSLFVRLSRCCTGTAVRKGWGPESRPTRRRSPLLGVVTGSSTLCFGGR